MWFERKPVIAGLFAVLCVAFGAPRHDATGRPADACHALVGEAPAASAAAVSPRRGLAHPASCKPQPPLLVDSEAVPGSGARWRLTLRTLDEDRDVRVWMQTTPADRRLVWQGQLAVGEARQVEVTYVPSAAAARVFVALEPAEMGTAIVRGLAVVDVPGVAQTAATSEGVLLEDPETGMKIRQFTGSVGGQE